MQLFEITVTVAQKDLETAQDIAVAVADSGIYVEDYSDLEQGCFQITGMKLIDEELLKKDRKHAVIHLYFNTDANIEEKKEQLKTLLSDAGVGFAFGEREIVEDDWSEAWKKYYHAVTAGKFKVVPCWEEYEKKDGEIILTLDPGMAFGTGTHESTRLCLEMVGESVKGGERFLDIGTGSGILAIGALLAGAKEARAFDIDPAAVKMSRYNAELNGLGNRFEAKQGGADESYGNGFDIVAANIVADVIIAILPTVKKLIKKGGIFITSGIINRYADGVSKAAEAQGFIIETSRSDNGWTGMRMIWR
ncbi:MAG TPA: 50S ribosomal protein L11 methyltransferase [Oscillospiraceae bacterium]|nr:50S ribosomal protein L11 methyltransferase [Oscillospiraceae bacterium]HPS33742.1 50S ribosomal protein L11 methyltransferase [Oscillospiraceae bacterium]